MQFRDWVQSTFGATDESILSKDAYPPSELREDKYKLQQRMRSLRKDIEEDQIRFRKLLEKAAKVSDHRQQNLKKKAQFARKRYQINQRKHDSLSLQYGTILSIEGARELMEMKGIDTNFSERVDELDTEDARELENHIMQQIAAFNGDEEIYETIQGALDFEFFNEEEEVSVSTSKEDEIIKQLQEGEMDSNEIDVDEVIKQEQQTEVSVSTESETSLSGETEVSLGDDMGGEFDIDVDDDIGPSR